VNSGPQAQYPVLQRGQRLSIETVDDGLRVHAVGRGESHFVPRDRVAGFGPAVVSPFSKASVGQWLSEQAREDTGAASWFAVDADGMAFELDIDGTAAELVACGPIGEFGLSRFRHDARSLLNAIGMNADLVRMLGIKAGLDAIAKPADRIKSSAASLAELVARQADSDGAPPVDRLIPSLADALQRLRFRHRVVDDVGAPQVSATCGAAVAGLFGQWAFWYERLIRLQAPAEPAVGAEPVLEFRAGAAVLWVEGKFDCRPDFAFRPARAAAAGIEASDLVDPTVTLRALGLGFGSWYSADSTGVVAGVPQPRI
jgi:hypothetical protein